MPPAPGDSGSDLDGSCPGGCAKLFLGMLKLLPEDVGRLIGWLLLKPWPVADGVFNDGPPMTGPAVDGRPPVEAIGTCASGVLATGAGAGGVPLKLAGTVEPRPTLVFARPVPGV